MKKKNSTTNLIIVLNIDTEESEYLAIYREIENKKIIFKELREVE